MKAFTLIETIMVIVIFSLLMGAVSGFIVWGYRLQGYSWRQSQAIEEARKGIEVMAREIRSARYGEDGSYVIWDTQDYQFGFFSDIDRDGEIERVRYFLDGTTLKKGVVEPVGIPAVYPSSTEEIHTISTYVRNLPPIFRYFDKQGNELPPPARRKDTKMMELFLVINVDPNRPPQNFELKTRVQLRNLKKEY